MKASIAISVGVIVAVFHSWSIVPGSLKSGLVPEWVERLGWTLVHSAWQLTAVAAIAAAVEFCLKHRRANARYVAGVATLVLMLALPGVTWTMVEVVPRTTRPPANEAATSDAADVTWTPVIESAERPDVLQVDPRSNTAPLDDRATSASPPGIADGLAATEAANGRVVADRAASSRSADQPAVTSWSRLCEEFRAVVEPRLSLLVALWLAGVVLCCLRPVWGLWTQWRLRRAGLSPVSDELQHRMSDLARRMGLTRVVRVAQSVRVPVPMVVGYLRPMILIPASVLTGLTATQLEALLAHELAHVRRHDWLVNALQVLVETLLFYHPAVWWLSSRIRHERELCCDDIALGVVGDRATYCRMLLALEELRHTGPPVCLAATGGDLVQRVRRLMPGHRDSQRASRGWLSGALLLLALGIASSLSVFARQTESTAPGTDVGPADSEPAEPAPAEPAQAAPAIADALPDDPKASAASTAIETGDPQMLSWSILVDGTLADELSKLSRNEQPRQEAFRVLQFDAARLRQALFNPAREAHVQSELRVPKVLPMAQHADDEQDIFGVESFTIRLPSGGTSFANAHASGKYVSVPGHPFVLDLKQFSIEIDASMLSGDSFHEIKPQSLSFRGDMPIGSAVAFLGEAERKSGTREFHVVLVYEAVPRVTEQAQRLLADVAWFKAGRAREKAVLQQAEAFNAKAAKLPTDLPARWTKPLPHGGSVSLIAIARPATHPFCWWDADGEPRAVDWSLQKHALSPAKTIALVCVRDPAGSDFEPTGVTYTFGGDHPPLPLYQRWSDLADSQLYLFSVHDTDAEQRPRIGVYAGDGPWQELGQLKPLEEATFGRADYILGELPKNPDGEPYMILGRRFLPDEDIRLRIIDKQGKVWPFPRNVFGCGVSDTKDVPPSWDGWEDYQARQVKIRDIDQIKLESRPRHWTMFTGFASEPEAATGKTPPRLKVAVPIAPGSAELKTQLSGKFDAMLQAKYRDIFRDEDRRPIVEDLRRFIDRHQAETLPAERASLIVRGFDDVVHVFNEDYLGFFPAYRSMKWRLWMALNARELTPEEVVRREQQRDEWREFIRTIPITDKHVVRTHGHAIDQLETLFERPWHGWFREPLSDDEMVQMERDRKSWNFHNPVFAHSHFDTIVMGVKAKSMQNDPRFGSGPLPLDEEILVNLQAGLLRFHTRFADHTAFNGPIVDLVYDEAPKPERRVLDFTRTIRQVPKSVPLGLEAVEKWAAEKQVGLLAYESKRHGLFMLRGAKLGVLPVSKWHEADRLSDAELFRIVTEQAKDSILLADYYGPRPDSSGYGKAPSGPLLVVESATGELGVVRVDSVSNKGITAHLRARPGAERAFEPDE